MTLESSVDVAPRIFKPYARLLVALTDYTLEGVRHSEHLFLACFPDTGHNSSGIGIARHVRCICVREMLLNALEKGVNVFPHVLRIEFFDYSLEHGATIG